MNDATEKPTEKTAEKTGERIKAIVVLKEGKTATEEEIIAYCKERIASYKKPRFVQFVESLPKTPTGKILKRVVRESHWSERDRKV